MRKIVVGKWRDDALAPMRVVSGAVVKEKVYYEAPPAAQLDHGMSQFLAWANESDRTDDVLRAVLNRLLDGFTGNLTTAKWAKLAKCSHDTALRDIQGLIELGLLKKAAGGGRSTSYSLQEE